MRFWRYIGLLIVGVVIGIALNEYGTEYMTVSEVVAPDVSMSQDTDDESVDFSERMMLERIREIQSLVEEQFYYADEVDVDVMRRAAVSAYVDGIQDPFTSYLDASENEALNDGLQGSEDFEGIGAKVISKDDAVMIEQVLKGSPALRAGLQMLDFVVAIDGESVANETLRESVARIRGPKGSTVELTVWRGVTSLQSDREVEPEILTIKVERDNISYPSVLNEIIERDGQRLAHIELTSVGETTVALLRDVIRGLDDIDGVILDLRGNGGGFLGDAVDISSFFIPDDRIVTTTKYSTYRDDVFVSYGYRGVQGLPLVVLIDGYTASAGEIIALAIREHTDTLLVGETTFGKGSIQTIEEFADGSSLKYTVGAWYAPDGSSVNETGVIPDIELERDRDAYLEDFSDNQLERAIQELL